MIDRVHFEKFKSLDDVTIELGRLTALVGPNGCGKSSVLQGMHMLSQTGSPKADGGADGHRFDWIFSGPRAPGRLASPGRPTTIKLEMHEAGGDTLALAIRVPAEGEEGISTGEEPVFEVSVAGPAGPLSACLPTKDMATELRTLNHPRVRRFVPVVYLHLNASEMSGVSIPRSETPRMRYDGAGLASTLAWMKGAAEDELDQLTRDLGRVVPGVKRIRTLRERVPQRRMDKVNIDGQPIWRPVDEEALGDRFEVEFDNGQSIPADLLSEGTVLALGLLTKLREPKHPRLILLDDIDRGLHIEAQAELVRVLRELLDQDKELQIVFTTHSPYLLDLLDPGDVRVLSLDPGRRTRALPLTEHPDFEKWKFGTQTGELWAALGEAWVAGTTEKKQ